MGALNPFGGKERGVDPDALAAQQAQRAEAERERRRLEREKEARDRAATSRRRGRGELRFKGEEGVEESETLG